jgi:L-rhamnose mutarotase
VLAAIAAANIRNYSIYRHDETLFAYFEYVGDDLAADMRPWPRPDDRRVVGAHRRDAGPYPERERAAGG